jgi:hypothetical protein
MQLSHAPQEAVWSPTRSGSTCRSPAMPNGRCRLDEGKSPRPRGRLCNRLLPFIAVVLPLLSFGSRLSRLDMAAKHVLGERRLRHFEAGLQQFTMTKQRFQSRLPAT